MNFEKFIAKRYLLSKHKINFITVISLISIIGITIGVAALVVVLSVFNGFGSLVTSFLKTFDPDIRIENVSLESQENYHELLALLDASNEVASYSPFISGKIIVNYDDKIEVVNLKGITEEAGVSIYNIKENVYYGNYSLSVNNLPEVIIGLRLADKLLALPGDTITIISPAGIERIVTQFSMPNMIKCRVAGVFSSNNNEYDGQFIFISISEAQNLFNYHNRVQGFDVKLKDASNSFKVKEKFEQQLSRESHLVYTWYDFHRELYNMMQIERWAAYILLSLIIAVASFNVLGSLSMSVIEKRRDIGILRSMGAYQKSIVKIFMFEGLLIGIIGTAAGLLLGYFISFLQIHYNIYPLDPTQYKIDSLPLEIRFSDFFYITGISLLLSFLASLFPAKRAAAVNPIEAIKWE
jgi:lipoprotein-releasing system permease protein